MIPQDRPKDASVRQNIRTTISTVQSIYAAAAVGLGNQVEAIGGPGGPVDQWFYSMVAATAPWDYKQYSPANAPRLYEDFGNFNFGATGAAAAYSLGTLQRMAGWVQQHGGDASMGSGTTSPTQLDARMGRGGVYPYGDELRDSEAIALGYQYYKCLAGNGGP